MKIKNINHWSLEHMYIRSENKNYQPQYLICQNGKVITW